MSYLNYTKQEIINNIKFKRIFFFDLSEDEQADKEIVMEFVKGGSVLNHILKIWFDDFDVMLEAVKHDDWSLNEASNRLKKNKILVLEAVKNYAYSLRFANKELQVDMDIVLTAIEKDGTALQLLPEYLRANKDIVLKAVKKDFRALAFASQRLQDDKELLEILEKAERVKVDDFDVKWYKERMEVLAIYKEKKIIEESINMSNKLSKKVKF